MNYVTGSVVFESTELTLPQLACLIASGIQVRCPHCGCFRPFGAFHRQPDFGRTADGLDTVRLPACDACRADGRNRAIGVDG